MKNHVIIITGANSGIGYAMTQTLLESDYRVAALDPVTHLGVYDYELKGGVKNEHNPE